MKRSELRQQVVNVIWAKGLYREFTAIQVEDVARAERVQASIEFISETLDKLMQRGEIEGRRLVVNGYGDYKWLKVSDVVSEQQQTAINLHHSPYRKDA